MTTDYALYGVVERTVFTPTCVCLIFDESDVFNTEADAQDALDEHQLECENEAIRLAAQHRLHRIADPVPTTRIVNSVTTISARGISELSAVDVSGTSVLDGQISRRDLARSAIGEGGGAFLGKPAPDFSADHEADCGA